MAQYRESLWRSGGYSSYYDYRTHDYGRIPASDAPLRGEARAQAEGHRGAAELRSAISSGRYVSGATAAGTRDERGRLTSVRVRIFDRTGKARTYTLRTKDVDTKRKRTAWARRLQTAGILGDWGYGIELAQQGQTA